MIKVFLTKTKFELLRNMTEKEIFKATKKFYKKKLNHSNCPLLNEFYQKHCCQVYKQILHDLDFQCHFSFYLYLYLKKNAVPFSNDPSESAHKLSQTITLNLTKTAKLAGVSRNTLKKSFEELVKKGLILYSNNPTPRKSNRPKIVLLVFDNAIIGYEKEEDKVCCDF